MVQATLATSAARTPPKVATANRPPYCRVPSDDVQLAVYRWGSQRAGRPTLVLVHGYPDTAAIWTPLAERLADDFHVVAYDVRGAGMSTAPTDRKAYRFEQLSADLRAVIDAVGPGDPVHLVGYDWGALQCWDAVLSGTLDGRVASLSAATPSLDDVGRWFQQRLRAPTPRNLAQVLTRALGSSYMLAMQVPRLPELVWQLGLGTAWPKLVGLIETVTPPAVDTQTADGINGLGLYRTNLLPALRKPRSRQTLLPGQWLVMTRDAFVPAALFNGLESTAPNFTRVELDAGHWAVASDPGPVADALRRFVNRIGGQ